MRFHKIFGAEQLGKLPCLFILAKTLPNKKSIKKIEIFCRVLIGLFDLQFLLHLAFVKTLF